MVISVGLATIAAAIGAGGLGEFIFRGLAMVDNQSYPCRSDSRRGAGAVGGLQCGMAGEAAAAAMKKGRSRFVLSSVLMLVALLLPSCAPSHADRIVVGSKNFTESFMLGELIAQQIEAHTHLKVERRFYLAGTYICQQAMLAGRIDIYPEYTGTALTAILKQKVQRRRAEVYQRVKSEYERSFGLTLGPAFGFNDTFRHGDSR